MKTTPYMDDRIPTLAGAFCILGWFCCFGCMASWLPAYLLWGLLGMICLWHPQPEVPAAHKRYLFAAAGILGVGAVVVNLPGFAPVYSLLSIANMGLSLAGSTIAGYRIFLCLRAGHGSFFSGKPGLWIRSGLIYLWALFLIPTDARYAVYLFCAAMAILCIWDRRDTRPDRKEPVLVVFAGLFSLAVVLANYPLFTPLASLTSLMKLCCCLSGGFCVGYQVLLAMMDRLPMKTCRKPGKNPGCFFAVTVSSISLIFLLYLFFASYPGLLTKDSNSTVAQILGTQPYDNTMPFWHTVTVQPFLRLGLAVFGTVDGGIALFHCAQILFMAVCFGCGLTTLYQIGVPMPVLAVVYCLYACIPYNIVYSVTLWKDVPFSGAALLMAVSLYRLIFRIGKKQWLNYLAFFVGAIGFSLWRTNGWYAFLAMFLVMVVLIRKKHRKLLSIMALVLILCWIMINPVLDVLGVSATNLVEAFAIPMQQAARVIANGRQLTQEQTRLLSDIFWLDVVEELYNPLSVDPIKFYAFRNGNLHCITDDPAAYIRLYFELGFRYPADYLQAWVDETKGYWNAGYEYWLYDLGQHRSVENPIDGLYTSIFRFLNETEVLKLFSSVGLYVWGMTGCCVVNALKKREEFLLSIPTLVLVIGLWLGTPVFCEFRYAYPLMVSLPVIACMTLYQKNME